MLDNPNKIDVVPLNLSKILHSDTSISLIMMVPNFQLIFYLTNKNKLNNVKIAIPFGNDLKNSNHFVYKFNNNKAVVSVLDTSA